MFLSKRHLDMWAAAMLRDDVPLATDILAEMDACGLRRSPHRDDILWNALLRALELELKS